MLDFKISIFLLLIVLPNLMTRHIAYGVRVLWVKAGVLVRPAPIMRSAERLASFFVLTATTLTTPFIPLANIKRKLNICFIAFYFEKHLFSFFVLLIFNLIFLV